MTNRSKCFRNEHLREIEYLAANPKQLHEGLSLSFLNCFSRERNSFSTITIRCRTGRSVSDPILDDNLIIHGDNLHALKSLLPMHAGKIDCIFIDPPYNGPEKRGGATTTT